MPKSNFIKNMEKQLSSNAGMHMMPGGHMMSDKEMSKMQKKMAPEMKKKRKKMM